MIISLSFEKYLLLDFISIKLVKTASTQRKLSLILIIITAFLGMLVTNDVALITVVPLTILIAKRGNFDPYKIIIFETLSANIGSTLTPFGNPQNLFLFEWYKIETLDFVLITLPFTLIGMIFVILFSFNIKNENINITFKEISILNIRKVVLYIFLFVIVILSIIRVIDYKFVTMFVFLIFILLDRDLFSKIDYYLLGTFIGFFIFVDNMIRIGYLQNLIEPVLHNDINTLLISALVSQFISNVPSSILLSGFTDNFKGLLLGVSVGGVGTLISSLANLISYKFYIKSFYKRKYLKYFYITNFYLFSILILCSLLFIK
jgi:Na+/H+ antiporter NhaD/arsenite permease-like protein